MLTIEYSLGKSDLGDYIKAEAKCHRKILMGFIASRILFITGVWGILGVFAYSSFFNLHINGHGTHYVSEMSSGFLGILWLIIALIFFIPKIVFWPYASLVRSTLRRFPPSDVAASTYHGKVCFGRRILTVTETHLTCKSPVAIDSVPWRDLTAVNVVDQAVIFRARFPPSAMFLYLPFHAFKSVDFRAEFISFCEQRINTANGDNASPVDISVNSDSTSVMTKLFLLRETFISATENAINCDYSRNIDDLAESLFWVLSGNNRQVTTTLFAPFVIPSFILLSLMPFVGSHVVLFLLGFFLAVLALAVLFRGRVRQALAMEKRRLKRELRNPDAANACLSRIEYCFCKDGFLTVIPALGIEKFISWWSVKDFHHDSNGIFLGGVADATGIMPFIPVRAFSGVDDMNLAAEFMQKAINITNGSQFSSNQGENRWGAIVVSSFGAVDDT